LQQHDVQLIDIIVSINGVQMNYKYWYLIPLLQMLNVLL
jgi:hypothetical protein